MPRAKQAWLDDRYTPAAGADVFGQVGRMREETAARSWGRTDDCFRLAVPSDSKDR